MRRALRLAAMLACGGLAGLAGPELAADEITLKSGTVIEGKIMSENAYEVQIQVARNESGTIRKVLFIDQDEVASMSRGTLALAVETFDAASGTATVREQTTPEEQVPKTVDLDRVEEYLQQTDGLLVQGKYDEALKRFESVASSERLMELHTRETEQAVEALELRVKAYKLWIIAMEGKAEHLEEREKQLENTVQRELAEAEERYEDVQDQLRKRERENRDSSRKIMMRTRQRKEPLDLPENDVKASLERAKSNHRAFAQWAESNAIEIQDLKNEIELLEEKTDQLERELSDARRAARRR